MDIKLEIRNAYDAFVKEHGEKPNVAYVKCWWVENFEPSELVQTIVLDGEWIDNLCDEDKDGEYIVPFIHDDDVLYYCSDVDSLIYITEWQDNADFKVCEFIGFERLT